MTASCPPCRAETSRREAEPVAEQRLVRKARERIVERLVGQLVLQADLLGHVAEAPHPAHDDTVDALGQRVALEHPAVLELDRVPARRLGRRVQLPHLAEERGRVDQLVEHLRDHVVVVAGLDGPLGQVPQLGEAAVEAGDAPFVVDHEDAVGGGLQGRGEHRVRVAELLFGPDPVRHVVARWRRCR